jgi:stage II sporulation protein AA (anti-sigma F factor antagonist)
MHLTEKKKENACIISTSGKIDSSNSTDFEGTIMEIIERGEHQIALDLEHLDYISSAGLRALIAIAKKIKKAGGKAAIFGMNAKIREIYESTGFVSVFPAYAAEKEALEFLNS